VKKINKKVYVGMSGGVDSSVSALLLKKKGYDVTGVFIKVWQPDWINCTWKEDRLDAMRICAKLEIPFITLDLENEYKKEVVDYMISEYSSGRTPNPDVMCNRYVKFGGFFTWAMKQGAQYVATGHYSQIKLFKKGSEVVLSGHMSARGRAAFSLDAFASPRDPSRTTSDPFFYVYKLIAGKDQNKDQSYFLWTLTQEQLSKTIFPVGNMEKSEVRKIAERHGLATASKKDSQGICFIGKIDVKEFLSHYIKPKKGNVLDEKGKIIGEHDGAFFFTIGERHGFTIIDKTPNDEPYFVISKDIKNNTITVANKNKKGELPNALTEVYIKDMNWNQGTVPIGKKFMARSRYREGLQEVVFSKENHIVFAKPQSTLSPGQSLVVYDGDVCLGGGVIC
jgi:tRNA-specific 2-thiouridylase